MWELVKALSDPSPLVLPKTEREVTIFATRMPFRSGYELHAHVLMAEMRGLEEQSIVNIVAGQHGRTDLLGRAVLYDIG